MSQAHARQPFFDAVVRALEIHAPEIPAARRIAIATDAALFSVDSPAPARLTRPGAVPAQGENR